MNDYLQVDSHPDIFKYIVRHLHYHKFALLIQTCREYALLDQEYYWKVLLKSHHYYAYRVIKIFKSSTMFKYTYKNMMKDIIYQKEHTVDNDELYALAKVHGDNNEFEHMYDYVCKMVINNAPTAFVLFADICCYKQNTYSYDLKLSQKFAELQIEYNNKHNIVNIEINNTLGIFFQNYGDIKKSTEFFEQNIKLGHVESAITCALYARNRNDFDTGLKYYKKALIMTSDSEELAEIYNRIGNIMNNSDNPNKNLESAIEYYTLAISYKQTYTSCLNRAKTLHALKRYTDALNDYHICLSFTSNDKSELITLYIRMLHCYEILRDYKQAIKISKKLIPVDTSSNTIMRIAYAYCAVNKYDKAEYYINQLNSLPNNYKKSNSYENWYHFLSMYVDYYKYKHFEKCIDHMNNIISDIPDCIYGTYRWKGCAYMMMNKYDEAMEYLNKALDMNISNGSLYADMAKLHCVPNQKYYDIEQAKTYLEKSMELYLKNPNDNHYSFMDTYNEVKQMINTN